MESRFHIREHNSFSYFGSDDGSNRILFKYRSYFPTRLSYTLHHHVLFFLGCTGGCHENTIDKFYEKYGYHRRIALTCNKQTGQVQHKKTYLCNAPTRIKTITHMKYSWILFDADNTLFDFTHSQKKALEHTFEAFGIKYHDDLFPLFTALNNRIWKAFDENKITHEEIKTERFKVLFNDIGVKNINLDLFNIKFIDNLILYSKLIVGTEQFILNMHKKVNMAIITNGMKEVQRPRFDNCKIKDKFKHIFISGEMGLSKPNKEYFEIVHKITGNAEKSKYLVVGDNIIADVWGGKNYGFDTCWYNQHKTKNEKKEFTDYEINKIEELSMILT